MNCFLFIFMITLAVATINPVDDVSYNKIVKLVNNFNSLTCKLDEVGPNDDLTNDEIVDIVNNFNSCKDTITQIQILISPLSTPGSTTPEPTTPEPITPEPITPVTTKLSDEDRDRITRMENKIQMLISPLGTTPTTATTLDQSTPSFTSGTRSQHRVSGDPGGNGFTTTTTTATTLDQSTPSFTSGTRSQHRVSGDPGGNGFTTTTTTATTLTDEDRDRITRLENKIQMLVSALTTPEPTTPEPTTPEPTTPEPKLSDEERIAHCGVINSMEDESITASSINGNNHHYGTQHSRLNTESGNGGWVAHTFKGSWIEIDMGTKRTVRGIATQGSSRSDHPYWVKSFTIGFKTSTSSSFQNIEDQSGAKKIFQGNTDRNTVVINDIDVEGRFIRIYPISWYWAPMLRFDILLC